MRLVGPGERLQSRLYGSTARIWQDGASFVQRLSGPASTDGHLIHLALEFASDFVRDDLGIFINESTLT
jgi:hypothetical protein